MDSLKWASSEAKQAVLGITGKPPDFWMDPHVNLVDLVEHEIPKLLKKMPGRLRTEKYREISEHTRLRDQRVKEGKIGQAIRSLVGKPPMFFDPSAMRTSPDHLELNPLKLFGAISDNFVDWHSPPGNELSGLSVNRPDWHLLIDSYDVFAAAATVKNIPEEFVKLRRC